MALDSWRKFMIEPLKEKLIKLILDGIDRDRKGESVNQSVIHGVINSLVDVADKRQKTLGVGTPFWVFSWYWLKKTFISFKKLYESLFEKVFIEQTGEYYKKEATKLLEENNCSSYMEKVSYGSVFGCLTGQLLIFQQKKALARLNEENLRSRRFLNPSSYNKVNQEVQKRLVEDYLNFLHSECKELIKNEVKHGKIKAFFQSC